MFRPSWDASTTPEQLHQKEKERFLEWRRTLATFQEEKGILLTPYEKNLEFWRQLWRVVEKSDVIVQIVDARNPLLFRCEDLEKYVKEVSSDKMNMILINKADFLTEQQRQHWANYFSGIGVRVVFFSAMLAAASDTKIVDEAVVDLKVQIDKLEEAVNVSAEKLDAITKQIAGLEEGDYFWNSIFCYRKVLTQNKHLLKIILKFLKGWVLFRKPVEFK